jgi:hypothetical protein
VSRWTTGPFEAALDAIRTGKSAEYLRSSNQEQDLEFVLAHVDDVETIPRLVRGELVDAGKMRGSLQGERQSSGTPGVGIA